MKKAIFCIPTLTKPHQACIDSLAACEPILKMNGWESFTVFEIGCPYISAARATMLRKALDKEPDAIVFIDHDISFQPQDMVKLLNTEGDVIAGTYRYKKDEEVYMGIIEDGVNYLPITREDGCIKAVSVPAGFLKITPKAVNTFIEKYPELCYGSRHKPHIDLFNHGAHEYKWMGEDYMFCKRWIDAGGEVWLVPDLDISHHSNDMAYHGNFHNFMLRQPGGSNDNSN